MEPHGRQPQEPARTKSWDYSPIMNLRGWMTVATLGDRAGVDLWQYQSADGRSLRKALDYLVPFARDPAGWPHKQIVKMRPGALAPLLRLAAARYGDKKYADTARDIAGGDRADWRDALLGLRP